MRINHLFIGATDVQKSAQFYCDFLGFVPTRSFNDGGGDSQIVHKEFEGSDLDLLIVPTGSTKLPYAHHVSFETDSEADFELRIQIARKMGLEPRAGVPLDSEPGVSSLTINGKKYRHFYVLDPSWVNVELMWLIQE